MTKTEDRNLPVSHAEMAGMLDLAKETLSYYCRIGRIPCPHRIGNCYYYTACEGAADCRVVGDAEEAHVQAGGDAMRRPELNKVPLASALAFLHKPGAGRCFITMSVGQWDKLLQGAYERGWTLLELDRKERPIAAYKRRDGHGVAPKI